MMSEEGKSFSESLVLDDSERGVVITGITDDTIAAKSGLQAGDEIVAATIHLDHLNKNEVLTILKVLEPYDNNMKVLTKKELSASAGLGTLGLGLKAPEEVLSLKKDLSLDASAEAPVVSFDGLNGKLNAAHGLGGDITGPTLNGDFPKLSVNKPSADADADANVTMPSLGLTGSNVKGNLNGSLNAPDVSVSTPSPTLDIENPEIKTGDQTFKVPKFTMPQFNLPQVEASQIGTDVSGEADLPYVSGSLEAPDLNLSSQKLDLKSPDLDVNGPKMDLNGPDIKAPNADIDARSGRIKWPHLKWKGHKVKGPDADHLNADLSAPDLSLSTPKIDGDVSEMSPNVDINDPDLHVHPAKIDIDAPSSKINWPHLKWKKNKLHGSKIDLDANLNAPDVDLSVPKVECGINAPDADINLPTADLESPNVNVEATSGHINWPHLKWKKPKFHGPKADSGIDADLNTPNLNLPTLEGDINAPNAEVNLPKADLKGPGLDVQAPDLDIDDSSGKIKWPHLKWKKSRLHGPKTDMDLNTDLSTPDVDLSVPKIDGEISTPDIDLNLPKVDVEAPDADIEGPSRKIKFPTLKKPKFLLSGPKVKSPDVDIDADVKTSELNLCPHLDGPDVELSVPKADADVKPPNVDIEAPSGKFKWPTLKKPKWSLPGSTVNSPDVDLDADVSAPDLSLSPPQTNGEIVTPDVNLNLPKADLEGPKLDINAPEVEGPSGKFKWFNFKKPKFGTLKGPKADIDGPEVDLSAPDVSASKIEGGIEASDLSVSVPDADVNGPDVNLNGPDLSLDSADGKVKFPTFKLPKFKGPDAKGPELDADLKAPDNDVGLDLPKVDVDAPNVDLKAPDLSLPAQKIEGGLEAPDFDSNLTKADFKGPDVDLKAPEADAAGKFRLPKIKLPKFGLSGPRVKGKGNLDVDTDMDLSPPDVKAPDVSLSAPAIKGDLSTPDLGLDTDLTTKIDLPAPKPHVCIPDLSLSSPKIKDPDVDLNLPKAELPNADHQARDLNFKTPDLSLSSPNMEGNLIAPNIDTKLPKAELEAPDVTLKAPNAEVNLPKADLKGPDVQLKTPDLDFDSNLGDLPHFKLPKLGLSSQEVEVPTVHSSVESGIEAPKVNIESPTADADISVPVIDLSVPKVEEGIKGPKVDVKAPNVDANLEKSKFPHFKLPKFNLSGSDIKAPEVEGEISSPDVSVSAPEVKTDINTPELGITADAEVKGSPKSKMRWPFKWGFKSGSEEEGSGVDSEPDVSNAEVEVPAFKFHRLPRNSIDDIGGIGDTLGLSKLDTEAKDYVVSKGIRLPIVNVTSKAGEKIDIMERLKMAKEKVPSDNVSPTEVKTDIGLKLTTPSLDVNASTEAEDSSLVRGGTFKVEKPVSVPSVVAPEILAADDNEKVSLGLSNMLGLNIKDSDAD